MAGPANARGKIMKTNCEQHAHGKIMSMYTAKLIWQPGSSTADWTLGQVEAHGCRSVVPKVSMAYR